MTEKNHIIQLIPQRPPIVMVDELAEVNEKGAKSYFTIDPANIFVEAGQLNEAGLVENMAQTAAARIGHICRQNQQPVPLGYIGAVQHLEVYDLPKIGEKIETEISIKNQIFDVTIISCAARSNGRQLARCDMKIFILNQP